VDWENRELAKILLRWRRKKLKKQSWTAKFVDKWISVPYVHLVYQFTLEAAHSMANNGHEAVHHMNYMQHILEVFGRELEGYRGTKENFCLKICTPVLQCRLHGPPDNYTPPCCTHISSSNNEVVTLADATTFYLKIDPLSLCCIPSHCWNLLYIHEVRWHLMVLLKKMKVTSIKDLNWGLRHHTVIFQELREPLHNVVKDEEEQQNPVLRLTYTKIKNNHPQRPWGLLLSRAC